MAHACMYMQLCGKRMRARLHNIFAYVTPWAQSCMSHVKRVRLFHGFVCERACANERAHASMHADTLTRHGHTWTP